jgi:hypothetical protein
MRPQCNSKMHRSARGKAKSLVERHPRRVSRSVRRQQDSDFKYVALPRRDRLTVLHGQLALLRLRCEYGLPITVGSLSRAERLALNLRSEKAKA